MAHLLTFDPEKKLDIDPDGWDEKNGPPTEKHLFEALWLAFIGVPANGEQLGHKLNLKTVLKSKSVEGGIFKLAVCPCCRQRWMVHQKNIRTIEGRVDFVLDNDDFEFLKLCPMRWQQVTGEIEDFFGELQKRLKESKAKTVSEWDVFLKERGKQ